MAPPDFGRPELFPTPAPAFFAAPSPDCRNSNRFLSSIHNSLRPIMLFIVSRIWQYFFLHVLNLSLYLINVKRLFVKYQFFVVFPKSLFVYFRQSAFVIFHDIPKALGKKSFSFGTKTNRCLCGPRSNSPRPFDASRCSPVPSGFHRYILPRQPTAIRHEKPPVRTAVRRGCTG